MAQMSALGTNLRLRTRVCALSPGLAPVQEEARAFVLANSNEPSRACVVHHCRFRLHSPLFGGCRSLLVLD